MNTVSIDGPLGPFEIPTTDHPRTREVCEQLTRQVWEGEYDHPELPNPKRGLNVIDIGAGWGAFSAWALARWPECYLWAYEPHEEAIDYWRSNLDGKPGRVLVAHMTNAAVTTDPAPHLNGCEDWGAYHTHNVLGGWPVPAVHPKDLPPCDILKADCEGCEDEVLEHYPHLVKCKALLIEFHGLDKKRRVFELAEAAGFRCVKQPPEGADYGATVWVRR